MFKSGDIIKSNAFMDVAVQVLLTRTNPETGDVEIDGVWINQGYVNTMYINVPAHFTIKKEHLDNWLKLEGPMTKCIRNEKWSKP